MNTNPLIRPLLRPYLKGLNEPSDAVGSAPPPPSSLAFKALDTVGDVEIGVGNISSVHADPLLALNETTNLYEEFAANVPVWINNWLQYYPAATNEALHSNDLTNVPEWPAPANAVTRTQDQVGLMGLANTATLLTKSVAGDAYISGGGSTTANTDWNTVIFWITKDSDQTRYPCLSLVYNFSTANIQLTLDTSTGVGTERRNNGGAIWEVIDEGVRWKVVISLQNNSSTGGNPVRIWPAFTTTPGTTDTSATGSLAVENINYHHGKTLAECRGLGPIYTQASSVTVARTVYSFDIANHVDAAGAYYFEALHSVTTGPAYSIVNMGTQSRIGSTGSRWNGKARTGAEAQITTSDIPVDTPFKEGCVYDASTGQIDVNGEGEWGNNLVGVYVDWDTGYNQIRINVNSFPELRIRNLRRYDISSYEEGKTLIDGLMA